jgi:hypothetical protein
MAMSSLRPSESKYSRKAGRRVTLTRVDLFRMEGKIAKKWREADQLGKLQQLSVVPEPGQAGKLTPYSGGQKH